MGKGGGTPVTLSRGVVPQKWGGTEQSCTDAYMVLKAKDNDRRKNLALSRDEFRGPRSDFVRQVAHTHANVPYNARCDGYDRERH
ncbi:hypothetical protein TNCV_3767881 [Trichonephila clavipes]|nr:hypothetical protein TNCV_3767881 [Trichonephila clavipes]